MPEIKPFLTPKQKALTINLNPNIYGTFAEIGAGQETVRHFFRAGGASGTIAKAMSAYDKDYSDAIYGKENKNRYVTRARLDKMLNHEVKLIEERLNNEKNAERKFFSYANTVTTINFEKTVKGHGWIGIMFQANPDEEYSKITLHIRFRENDSTLQQETLGLLGVNLIYGAFYLADNPRRLIKSLYDDISKDKIEIDMVDFSGPAFKYVDNRLMSLQLVKNNFTDVVIFSSNGENLLPEDEIYKKNIFVTRGSFRPVTKVSIDMFENGLKMFKEDAGCSDDDIKIFFEITLSNLKAGGSAIDERDFLNRVDILCNLGYTVMISNFSEYYKLVDYFSSYNIGYIGLAMGVNNLLYVFDEKYYSHLSGGILEAFGKFFRKGMRVYMYPYKNPETQEILNSDNLKVDDNLKELYKYFKHTRRIVDIEDYNPEYSEIYPRNVLKKIVSGEKSWEKEVPDGVAEMIKERKMFGYKDDLELKEFK